MAHIEKTGGTLPALGVGGWESGVEGGGGLKGLSLHPLSSNNCYWTVSTPTLQYEGRMYTVLQLWYIIF